MNSTDFLLNSLYQKLKTFELTPDEKEDVYSSIDFLLRVKQKEGTLEEKRN